MLKNVFPVTAALVAAASALAVEVEGLEEVDTRPPEGKPAVEEEVTPEPPVEEPSVVETPEAVEAIPPEEPSPRARRPLGITVRASYLLPSSAKDVYAGALAFGASYALAPEESRLSYEFGLDAAWSERDDGTYSTALTFLRAAALYKPSSSAKGLYLLGGANVGLESVDGSQSSPNSAGAVDLGVGGKFGGLDTRLAYSIYLGSENAGGALALSVGYAF